MALFYLYVLQVDIEDDRIRKQLNRNRIYLLYITDEYNFGCNEDKLSDICEKYLKFKHSKQIIYKDRFYTVEYDLASLRDRLFKNLINQEYTYDWNKGYNLYISTEKRYNILYKLYHKSNAIEMRYYESQCK